MKNPNEWEGSQKSEVVKREISKWKLLTQEGYERMNDALA